MSLLAVAGANSVSTGYDIDNSLKFESDNTEYLTYTPSSTTNVKTWTFSCWAKRTELYNGSNTQHLLGHYTDGSNHTAFRFDDADVLELRNVVLGNAAYEVKTDQVFRDTSAWYHIVIAFDTTQATAADRTKVYVNGNQVTLSGTFTPQNQITYINTSGDAMGVGTLAGFGNHFNGYMAEIHHIDGQQLAASDFGEFDTDTGIWKPKAYAGTYGTNGFYLDFEDSASLGADDSGNGNNFTLNNITSADQATDTPTNNFCILTAVANFYRTPQTENATKGGTSVSDSSVTNAWTGTMATTPLFTGKWYWEVRMNQPSEQLCGIHDFNGDVGSNVNPYQVAGARSWVVYGGGAYWIKSIDGTSTTGTSETAFSNGTIVGVALDLDNHLLTFYENGGSAGTNLTNIDISSVTNVYSGAWMPHVGVFRNSLKTNFGGFSGFAISSGNADENGYGNFEYAPPSGFLAICSKNLAES